MCSRLVHSGSDRARSTFDIRDERVSITQGLVECLGPSAVRGDIRRAAMLIFGNLPIAETVFQLAIVVRDASGVCVLTAEVFSFPAETPKLARETTGAWLPLGPGPLVRKILDKPPLLASTGAPT